MKSVYLFLTLFCLQASLLNGQNEFVLDSTFVDTTLVLSKNKVKYVEGKVEELWADGFFEANIDTIIKKDSMLYAQFHKGIKYDTIEIDLSALPSDLKDEMNLPLKLSTDYAGFQNCIRSLKHFNQEHGYIFVYIESKDTHIKGKRIQTALHLKKNRRMQWGDITFGTEIQLPPKYLFNLIDVRPGDPFKKSDLDKLKQAIVNLKYVQLASGIKVSFFENTAEIKLYLSKSPANNFDVLLGLQSNTDPLGAQNYFISGTAHIDLYNVFDQGENLFVEYKQLKQKNQKIEVKTSWPFIKILPTFGAEAAFKLHRRDSLSLELNYGGALSYNISPHLKLTGGVQFVESRILTIDTLPIIASKRLPENRLDLKHNNFIVGINYEKLDNRLNPRRGLSANITSHLGQKRIIPNSIITNLTDTQDPSFSYSALYESLELQTFNYNLESNVTYFIPLKKRSAIMTALNVGTIQSKGKIYDNESFRLGGHHIIRGFNEEELNTSQYISSTVEYRFLLSNLSNIYTFFDGSLLKSKIDSNQSLFYMGIGLGMNLNIKGGVLGLSYAVGKRNSEGLDFVNSKIHFKYVNYF